MQNSVSLIFRLDELLPTLQHSAKQNFGVNLLLSFKFILCYIAGSSVLYFAQLTSILIFLYHNIALLDTFQRLADRFFISELSPFTS